MKSLLDKTKVCCYLTNIENLDADALLKAEGIFLEPSRLERIGRCKNEKKRKELICTGVLLKRVLEHFGEKSSLIKESENGKPYLDGEKIFFNISHSKDYVLIAVSGSEVGIDIQKPAEGTENLVSKIFSDEERRSYNAGDFSFSFLWALKESYMKLTGQGLSKDMKDITFVKTGDTFRIYDRNVETAYAYKILSKDGYESVVCSYCPVDIELQLFEL